MIKILFVCHGNICRSPMAEFVMKKLVAEAGRAHEFKIDSAATSSEEIGNPVYPPARRELARHGIDCQGKRSRRLQAADYEAYDFIIGMDRYNMQNMQRLFGSGKTAKLSLLMDHTDDPHDVADPWYSGDFDLTYRDVLCACQALLATL